MQKYFKSCDFKLVRPDKTYEEQWQYAVKVLQDADGKIIPNNLEATNFANFLEQTRNFEKGENLPDGYVPSELYFFVSKQNPSVILGVTDLRLRVTPDIERFFGQAGGSIIPEYRKNGWGKYIIKLTLDMLCQKGFESIILTCEEKNESSRRAIIANGGIFQGVSILGGKKIERYQIKLTSE